jgi:uncharacterized protein (TIGR03435 family)
VRPNRSGDRSSGTRPVATGQFTATNVTLRDLTLRAWALHESQLLDAPDWVASERYDIVARSAAPPGGGVRDVWLMVRGLLVEHFQMRVREDTRVLPAYELVPARDDRRLGPRIRQSVVDCAANPVPIVPNTAPLDGSGWPPCGLAYVMTMLGAPGARSRSSVKQSAVSMEEVAGRLMSAAGRPVIDRTGLAGRFDVEYEYVTAGAAAPGGDATLVDVPDLFTALREQLGLELRPARTAVPVLVIESVQRPEL